MKVGPAFLLAPGAGAPSSDPRMQTFLLLLSSLGYTEVFDYPYMLDGRKRPDPLPRLVSAHRAALDSLRSRHRGPIFLVGKSMGGRVGCHVALVEEVAGIVCLGYPLCGGCDTAKLRDEVLIALLTPVLFVQGTRESLYPHDLLEKVRARMSAKSSLDVVEAGDHSLIVSKTQLKAIGATEDDVDHESFKAVEDFVCRVTGNCEQQAARSK